MSNNASFKSMKYLIGEPLKAIRVPHKDHLPDGEVMIVEEHEKTVLLDMEYIAHTWWGNIPPRHIRTLVSKASILCGDVVLKRMNGEVVRAELKGVATV